MAASPIDRIVAMLSNEAPEKRIAAAIVLAELRPKGAKIERALASVLPEAGPPLQRHALDALALIGAKRAVPEILVVVGSRDQAVRAAAIHALVSVGPEVVPQLEACLPEAGSQDRRALEKVLARLGGKEAMSALFAGLEEADEEAAAAAAVAMRSRVRDADARQRRSYRSQLDRVLARQAKRESASVPVVKAAIKMLGYLEDEQTIATLLTYAAAKKQPASVRQEALIALRFSIKGRKPSAKLISALVAAAAEQDRTLAQTALMTLSGMDLPVQAASKLDPLLNHPDVDRARFVIDMLKHRPTADAAALLVNVLVTGGERRSRSAADALAEREDAAGPLAKALERCEDPQRARTIGRVLQPMAGTLDRGQRKKLLASTLKRLAEGSPGWEPAFEVARIANAAEAAAGLRALYEQLRRKRTDGQPATTALRLMCRSGHCTDDDRYELASRMLASSPKDPAATARKADEALELFERLLRSGFDVVGALRRDRSTDLDALYYVGFHFAEAGHPAGEDLLRHVADKGGRKKIGRMAKNKLELTSGA